MRSAFIVILCLSLALPLSAQGPARFGLSSPTVHTSTSSRPLYPRSAPPTEWRKGMLIGGIVGLAVGVLGVIVNRSCESRESDCGGSGNDVLILLGPTAVFALIGGLIGSGFHKKE